VPRPGRAPVRSATGESVHPLGTLLTRAVCDRLPELWCPAGLRPAFVLEVRRQARAPEVPVLRLAGHGPGTLLSVLRHGAEPELADAETGRVISEPAIHRS